VTAAERANAILNHVAVLARDLKDAQVEIGHLQARLAERRKNFRDLEHRHKTAEGARKAISELGKKLQAERRRADRAEEQVFLLEKELQDARERVLAEKLRGLNSGGKP
jgi:septal ring factor EnvC (AmiA/AmiB activator)